MFLEKWVDFSKYVELFKEEMEVLNFEPSRVAQMLKFMGQGMLVIFVIIGIIIISTVAINKFFSKKKDK
ncbi:MAG: hypothetical protein UHN02_03730 [Acutalibacteraceae bacterium]|nr:hypothetical protein [Acutalibacteraceae bacterium]